MNDTLKTEFSPTPTSLAVFRALIESYLDEMGELLCFAAFSQNIKERRDYSCAIFNSSGDLICGANHIPVHLGSMDTSCKAAISTLPMNNGDAVVLNDPFSGGTHLPDITIIFPVCLDEKKSDNPELYLGVRAHHSDIGGIAPGSLPLSKKLSDEGLILKPNYIMKNGGMVDDVIERIARSSRQPDERRGDIKAQTASGAIGIKRLKELAKSRGIDRITLESDALIEHSAIVLRDYLSKRSEASGIGIAHIDSTPDDPGAQIACSVTLKHHPTLKIQFDFSNSSDAHPGNLNANEAIVRSAVIYSLRLFLPDETPVTSGLLKPVDIVLRKNSVLDPPDGTAVAGGNVETSQAIVEACLKALSQIGWNSPASSQGTMNNILIGSDNFSFYETNGGGAGASDSQNGESGIQTHMTNTRNTPIESIERDFPLRILSYKIVENSGGQGKYSGGDGIIREYQILENSVCTVLSGHRNSPPDGTNGGAPGVPGKNTLIRNGEEFELPARAMIQLLSGDILRIQTPSGGGYGKTEN